MHPGVLAHKTCCIETGQWLLSCAMAQTWRLIQNGVKSLLQLSAVLSFFPAGRQHEERIYMVHTFFIS